MKARSMTADADLASVLPYVLIHAEAESPRECCGVIIREGAASLYVACRNIALDSEHFVIDPVDLMRAEESGPLIGYAHSHPFIDPEPSQADLVGIERTGLPWLIANHPTGRYTITRPTGYVAPLIGRTFVHGVHDCYGLVRDYYATHSVKLNDYPRAYGWWDDMHGPDLYRSNFATEGFSEVPRETLREHDLILMRIHAKQDNHMAVYLGDGVILHHMLGQLSRREFYGEHFQRRTTAVLRHRTFLKGPTC